MKTSTGKMSSADALWPCSCSRSIAMRQHCGAESESHHNYGKPYIHDTLHFVRRGLVQPHSQQSLLCGWPWGLAKVPLRHLNHRVIGRDGSKLLVEVIVEYLKRCEDEESIKSSRNLLCLCSRRIVQQRRHVCKQRCNSVAPRQDTLPQTARHYKTT